MRQHEIRYKVSVSGPDGTIAIGFYRATCGEEAIRQAKQFLQRQGLSILNRGRFTVDTRVNQEGNQR